MKGFAAFQPPNSCVTLLLERRGIEVADRGELRRLGAEEVTVELHHLLARHGLDVDHAFVDRVHVTDVALGIRA